MLPGPKPHIDSCREGNSQRFTGTERLDKSISASSQGAKRPSQTISSGSFAERIVHAAGPPTFLPHGQKTFEPRATNFAAGDAQDAELNGKRVCVKTLGSHAQGDVRSLAVYLCKSRLEYPPPVKVLQKNYRFDSAVIILAEYYSCGTRQRASTISACTG